MRLMSASERHLRPKSILQTLDILVLQDENKKTLLPRRQLQNKDKKLLREAKRFFLLNCTIYFPWFAMT